MFSFGLQPFRRPEAGNPFPLNRRLSASLLRNRHALARRLMESLSGWEKYDQHIQNNPSDSMDYLPINSMFSWTTSSATSDRETTYISISI